MTTITSTNRELVGVPDEPFRRYAIPDEEVRTDTPDLIGLFATWEAATPELVDAAAYRAMDEALEETDQDISEASLEDVPGDWR